MMRQLHHFTHRICLILSSLTISARPAVAVVAAHCRRPSNPWLTRSLSLLNPMSRLVGPPYGGFAEQSGDPEDFDSLVASFETSEYAGMQGLSLINASSAYARGANGSGVSLGIIDSGVYAQHLEFTQGLGDKVTVVGSDYGDSNQRSNQALSHGTMVAGVLAANRDDRDQANFNMHGVAYNASIHVYEIPLQPSDGPYDPVGLADLDFGTDNYFASRFNAMTDKVDIINMSFGFSGLVTDYSASAIQSRLSNTLSALRQSNRPLGSRAIFVVSAGNGFGNSDEFGNLIDATSPELLSGLPYLFPELQPHMLAVAAVDTQWHHSPLFKSLRCCCQFLSGGSRWGRLRWLTAALLIQRLSGPLIRPPRMLQPAATHYSAAP